MKITLFDELEVGDMVIDTWWRYRGWGIITKKFKRTIHINWGNGPYDPYRIYDKPHTNQFLEKVER